MNKDFDKELLNISGNLKEELSEADLEQISGAGLGKWLRKLSKGNDGKICTLTWECGSCPSHTCMC